MQISELIATLHHEVAKSYTFIAETKGDVGAEASVLHINIERLEIELPITLSQQEVEFKPTDVKGQPIAFQKLSMPFTPHKDRVPKKPVTGKTIMAEIVGPAEKVDDRVSPESVGRIKIMFKLVIS
jgi:hypothetical protein